MDAQFFAELVEMVDEAEAALTALEKYTSNEFPNLGPIATVCIDGDKLHEGIRRVLPVRDQDPFQRAVFGFRGPQAAVRRPGANQRHHEALHLIKRCAITAKEKLEGKPDTPPATTGSGYGYVNTVRIQALKDLSAPQFDPKRLIRLLEELNDVHAAGCHMATAMVVRSILDHVPPVFELENFSQVGNNFGGTKSFKKKHAAFGYFAAKHRRQSSSLANAPKRRSPYVSPSGLPSRIGSVDWSSDHFARRTLTGIAISNQRPLLADSDHRPLTLIKKPAG